MPRLLARALPWLAPAAVALGLLAALPPVGSYARQYASVQALQFVVFAVAVPALLLLGITSRPERCARRTSGRGASPGRRARSTAPALRLPAGIAGHRADAERRAVRASAVRVLLFVALVITWRLPAVLDALARHPALAAAQGVTLVCARLGGLGRPRRRSAAPPAAAAAVACRHRRHGNVGHLDSCLHHWHVRRATGQPRANRRCVERCRRSPARSRRDVGGPGRLLHARRVHHADPMARRARRPGRRTPRRSAPRLQHH